MKAVVVCALLFVVAACALETLPRQEEHKGLGQAPKPFQTVKDIKDKPLAHLTKGSSSSSSGSGSQHKHASAKLLALKAVDIFGDADGSAGFKGQNVLENTIAEVPAKKKGSKSSSSNRSSGTGTSGSGSGSKKLLGRIGKLHKKKDHAKLLHKKKHSGSSKSSGGSSTDESKTSPRTQRPLFNFKTAPRGADSVVLRKHHFSAKHHKLVTSFANKNEKIQFVLVVDAYVSPRGRPSKKAHDTKKRGHRKSEVNVPGVVHHNVFIFDDKGKQLFPKPEHSHHSSGSRSGTSSSLNKPVDLNKLAANGPRPGGPAGQVHHDMKNPRLPKH